MYRIEFRKEDLLTQEHIIGEVDVEQINGELKVFGVTYKTGVECAYKGDAESLAKQFERRYNSLRHRYKVTTEVYNV